MVVGVGEYWEEDEEWLEEFPGEDAGGRIQSEISGGDDGDDVHADVDEEGGADVHHVAKVAGGVILKVTFISLVLSIFGVVFQFDSSPFFIHLRFLRHLPFMVAFFERVVFIFGITLISGVLFIFRLSSSFW